MHVLEALMRAYISQDNPDGFLTLFTAYAGVLEDPQITWQEIPGIYTLEFAGAINREALRMRAEGMSSQSDALMKLCKKMGFFVNKQLTSIYDVEARASYDRGGEYDRT